MEIIATPEEALQCLPTESPILTRPTGSSDFFKACVNAYAEFRNISVADVHERLERLEVVQRGEKLGYVLKLIERKDP